jgi:hypothetical protein
MEFSDLTGRTGSHFNGIDLEIASAARKNRSVRTSLPTADLILEFREQCFHFLYCIAVHR